MARDALVVMRHRDVVRAGGGGPLAGRSIGALVGPAAAPLVQGAVAVYAERQETRRYREACRTARHAQTERRRTAVAALASGVECLRAMAAIAPHVTPEAQLALVERFDPVALVAAGLQSLRDPPLVPAPLGSGDGDGERWR